MYSNLAIEHLKSGLSINTHIGCSLNCKYCVLKAVNDYPDHPVKVKSTKEIIESLYSDNSIYIADKTPIYINNRTDPFLPDVIESTYDVLEQLELKKCKSPIIIITKLSPDARIKKMFDKLNIIVFYTFSNLPSWDFNSDIKIALKHLEKITAYIPQRNRFHYYRPIIPGINDTLESFIFSMNNIGRFFSGTVVGGIRINDFNKDKIGMLEYDVNHKMYNIDFNSCVEQYIDEYCGVVFRHTSCAISYYLKQKNKLDYYNRNEHCYKERCPNHEICKNLIKVEIDEIKDIIMNITNSKYVISNNVVHFVEPVSQEVVACLKNAYGIIVQADNLILSPSEKQITEL